MKSILAGAALVTAIALGATGASSAPFANLGKAAGATDAGIIKVHGIHRECVEGRFGWHRSTPWGGRIACSPPWRKHYRHGHGHDHHHGYDRHPEPRRMVKPEPRYEPKPAPRHGSHHGSHQGPRHTY